jgi:hypothetical protein
MNIIRPLYFSAAATRRRLVFRLPLTCIYAWLAEAAKRSACGDNIRHGAVPAVDKYFDAVHKRRRHRNILAKDHF